MSITQNHIEHLQNLMSLGKITADEANVEMVKMARVKLVTCRMTAQVRKALNDAVKKGELGHMKKDGHKPEAYYLTGFDHLAKEERGNHAQSIKRAVKSVMV